MKLVYTNESGKKVLTEQGLDRIFGYSLLLPTFLVFAIVIMYPIFNAVIMSFSDYTYFTVAKGDGFNWNGFKNYETIIKNGFINQLGKTLIYTAATVVTELVLGMSIALMLNSSRLSEGRGILRSLYLMPWTIPSI